MKLARGRPGELETRPGPNENTFTAENSEQLPAAEADAEVLARLAVTPRRIVREPWLPPGLAIGILPETPTERAARVRDRQRSLDRVLAQVTPKHERLWPRELAIALTILKRPGEHPGKPDAKYAVVGERVVRTFDELARMLVPTINVAGPIDPQNKPTESLGCLSFATFVGKRDDGALGGDAKKNNASCVVVSCCVLDVEGASNPRIVARDGETPFEALDRHVLEFPFPWRALVFDTTSSTWALPRQRIVLPYSRPCAPDEHERITKALVARLVPLGVQSDPTTHQQSRGWYYGVRARMPDGSLAPFELLNLDGPLLDVDAFLAELDAEQPPQSSPNARLRSAPGASGQAYIPGRPPESELPPLDSRLDRARTHLATCAPSVSGHGGRGALWNAALYPVRGLVITEDTAVEMLAELFNPRCVWPDGTAYPWEHHELRSVVHRVHRDGKSPWGYALAGDHVVYPDLREHVLAQIDHVRGRAAATDARVLQVLAELAYRHGPDFGLAIRTLAGRLKIAESTASISLRRLRDEVGVVEVVSKGRNGIATRYRVGGPNNASIKMGGGPITHQSLRSRGSGGCSGAELPLWVWARSRAGESLSAARPVYFALRERPGLSIRAMAREGVASRTTLQKGLHLLQALGAVDATNTLVPDADARLLAHACAIGLDVAVQAQVTRHERERHLGLDEDAWLALAAAVRDEIARLPGPMRELATRATVLSIIDARLGVGGAEARQALATVLRWLQRQGMVAKAGRCWRALQVAPSP